MPMLYENIYHQLRAIEIVYSLNPRGQRILDYLHRRFTPERLNYRPRTGR